MKLFKNLQAWMVVAAFAGTLALLFGGQALNTKFKVTEPLQRELASRREIQHFAVRPVDDGVAVELTVKQTNDLKELLEFVKTKVEWYHQKPVTSFVIQSNSNKRLEKIRYDLSFYLEEALASGHYIQLKSALDNLKEDGLISNVYLTDDYVYLQLEEGSHYLYQAVPRTSRLVTFNNTGTGGGSL
ncbi:MAG TPA: hypothetical protein PL004_01875 [Bacillota bacterium]|nr:hypothetical protein [Bacillota bacterium]